MINITCTTNCKVKKFVIRGAPRSSQELVQKCLCIPGSNWNLERLVFEKRGKLEKNLLKESREPTTNSTHIKL